MIKTTVNKLISLIIEEINKEQNPPDKPIYFKTFEDVLSFYDLRQDS